MLYNKRAALSDGRLREPVLLRPRSGVRPKAVQNGAVLLYVVQVVLKVKLDHLHERVQRQQRVRPGLVHRPDPVHAHHLGDLVQAAVEAVAKLAHVLHVKDPWEEHVEDLEEVALRLGEGLAGQDLATA